MNDTPRSDTQGTNGADGGASDPIADLRERHKDAVSGRQDPRGVKPGTKRGSYNKGPRSNGGATPSPTPAAPSVAPPSNESLNKKMGMVWRTVGHGLALGTNCTVWLLDAEQEKLLGEAYGDLCSAFGLADTTAFKIVFCVGTTIGIMGAKAFGYAQYKAALLAEQEKRKKDLKGDAGKTKDAPPPAPDAPPTPPTEVHETKPGTL